MSACFGLLLSQYTVSAIPTAVDAVSCGSPERVTAAHARALIVLGANDGILPAAAQSEGVFSNEERRRLEEMGIHLSPYGLRKQKREQQLLYQMACCPTEKLAFFLRAAGWAGAGAPAVAVFGSAAPCPARVGVRYQRQKPDEEKLWAPKPCFDLACTALRAPLTPAARAAAQYYAASPRLADIRALARRARGPLVGRTRLDGLYGPVLSLTASRVDRFYQCPFSYFMDYGLRAREVRPAEFDAPEAGTFLHDVLEHVLRRLREEHPCPRERAGQIAQEEIDRFVREVWHGLERETPRFVYLFRRLGRMVTDVALHLWREMQESAFEPLALELSFAPDGDVPPLERQLEDGRRLRVLGKVDRVDVWRQGSTLYLRVLDYKSGHKSFALGEVLDGLNMQLLIYLFALQETGLPYFRQKLGEEIQTLLPAGVLYVPVRQPVIQAPRDSAPETIEQLREKAWMRSGIVSGDIGVLEAMDAALAQSGRGRYTPVRLSRDRTVSAASCVADAGQWVQLRDLVEDKLEQMGRRLTAGDIAASPVERGPGKRPCVYCPYAAACQFDPLDPGDEARRLKTCRDDEFWSRMGGKRDE